jgi:hypothetical protein
MSWLVFASGLELIGKVDEEWPVAQHVSPTGTVTVFLPTLKLHKDVCKYVGRNSCTASTSTAPDSRSFVVKRFDCPDTAAYEYATLRALRKSQDASDVCVSAHWLYPDDDWMEYALYKAGGTTKKRKRSSPSRCALG